MTLSDWWKTFSGYASGFWASVKNFFPSITKTVPGSTQMKPEPAPIDVEEIEFPKWESPEDISPDLVIDFGTTATVIGTSSIKYPSVNNRSLDLLAGDTEFTSEMSIDSNGNVSAVGRGASGAYMDSQKPGHVLVTSMKRYLELASRGGSSAGFHEIVEVFLEKAVGERYRKGHRISPTSEIIISVPNSFNPRAIEDLRTGVVNAINDLNNDPESLIHNHNVKLVRESEAVAYLYCRKERLNKAPTMEDAVPNAAFEWETLHPAKSQSDGPQRMIVLDVGGGTTDLSVVEVAPKASEDGAVRVILNAGVALGGTDVDNLLLRGLLSLQINPANISNEWPIDQRVDLLNQIRKLKDSNADQIFATPEQGQPDEFRKELHKWLNQVPGAVQRFDPGTSECSEENTATYRKEANSRLMKLIRLSVIGLFDLIPDNAKNNVSRILLTGRAARLRAIREAVIEQAETLGASVEYPRYAYHAKLVVAYGCALVNSRDFTGSRLPTGTLGRRLQVIYSGEGVFASFETDFPVSAEAPTLFQARLPGQEKHGRVYFPGEMKTEVTNEFTNEMNEGPGNSKDYLEWLGCGRAIAMWEVKVRQTPTTKFLLLRPENETYYTIEKEAWKERQPEKPLSWSNLNYITGLPLAFPHEGMEGKLGSRTEGADAS